MNCIILFYFLIILSLWCYIDIVLNLLRFPPVSGEMFHRQNYRVSPVSGEMFHRQNYRVSPVLGEMFHRQNYRVSPCIR